MSDRLPPDDFDPYELENPMQRPRQSKDERQQCEGAFDDGGEDESAMTHLPLPIPESLKKKLLAGSCCTGVAVLYFISGWDHGWIPGLQSQFAKAEDVQAMEQKSKVVDRLVVLQIAREIRELTAVNCAAPTEAVSAQIDALRHDYWLATNGGDYPHVECKRA